MASYQRLALCKLCAFTRRLCFPGHGHKLLMRLKIARIRHRCPMPDAPYIGGVCVSLGLGVVRYGIVLYGMACYGIYGRPVFFLLPPLCYFSALIKKLVSGIR